MFGPRLGTVFASRWKALLWAGGVLLLAWQVVPSPDGSEPTKAENKAATEAAKRMEMFGQQQVPVEDPN